MSGFISGADRSQGTMFPAQLEDYVAEDNPVRVIDFFVDQLDLLRAATLGQWEWPAPSVPPQGREMPKSLLEREFKDMQDIEFTVEEGQLYFLQTRSGKRTPRAALLILIDLLKEGIINESEGASRVKDIDLEATAVTRFSDDAEAVARDGASPGVASGRVAFDSARAAELAKFGDPIILVRPETSIEDIAGFALAAAL